MTDDNTQTPLSIEMRALADQGHARAEELRALADAFDLARAGYYGEPKTVTGHAFLGAWARAHRLFSECSGEPIA